MRCGVYLLRWGFEYQNRPSKMGLWSRSTRNPSDMASFQPTDGLVTAFIEIKDQVSRQIRRVAEVPGPDYCLFKWVAELQGALTPAGVHKLVGLTLVSRTHEATVFAKDGSLFLKTRTEEDKNFHYEAYGR